jgi:hypothetical protein
MLSFGIFLKLFLHKKIHSVLRNLSRNFCIFVANISQKRIVNFAKTFVPTLVGPKENFIVTDFQENLLCCLLYVVPVVYIVKIYTDIVLFRGICWLKGQLQEIFVLRVFSLINPTYDTDSLPKAVSHIASYSPRFSIKTRIFAGSLTSRKSILKSHYHSLFQYLGFRGVIDNTETVSMGSLTPAKFQIAVAGPYISPF